MKKNKGFTMVELLAAITILGIIMMIAVPNVLSIIDKNKKRTYVEDAKKIQSLAETYMRSDSRVERPDNGKSVIIMLGSLDMTELKAGPEGGEYQGDTSFVAIYNNGGTYEYSVALYEKFDAGGKATEAGINLTNIDRLNSESAVNNVVRDTEVVHYNLTVGQSLAGCGRIQAIF